MRERPCDRYALLHAAGKLARVTRGELGKPDQMQQLACARSAGGAISRKISAGSSTFCRAVRHCISAGTWNTSPILRCGPFTGAPSTRTVPLVADVNPAIIFNMVVLPQPLGPSTETNSPGSIRKLTPARVWISVSAVE